MSEGEFPVTIDIDGKKVVVGTAKLVQRSEDQNGATVAVTLDVDSLEGSQFYKTITKGMSDSLSISSSGAEFINKEKND